MPDALATYVEAAGQLAAAAVERGERAEARRVLEDALRTLEAWGCATVRLIRGRA